MGDCSFEAIPCNRAGPRLTFNHIYTILTAGIPGRRPTQDTGESLLTISWLFQRPVNGVSQATGLRRGRVWLTYGRFMCRKLPYRLRKQFLLPDSKYASAGRTSQTDFSGFSTYSASPEQAGLTASATQLWPYAIRFCPARKLPTGLFRNLFLHLLEGILFDDGRVSIFPRITGILQHSLDFVLVPQG